MSCHSAGNILRWLIALTPEIYTHAKGEYAPWAEGDTVSAEHPFLSETRK